MNLRSGQWQDRVSFYSISSRLLITKKLDIVCDDRTKRNIVQYGVIITIVFQYKGLGNFLQ